MLLREFPFEKSQTMGQDYQRRTSGAQGALGRGKGGATAMTRSGSGESGRSAVLPGECAREEGSERHGYAPGGACSDRQSDRHSDRNSDKYSDKQSDSLSHSDSVEDDGRGQSQPLPWPPPIPEEFLCPLSQQLMADPVILSSGATLDRPSAAHWLAAGHRSCPLTGHPLEHVNVCPNLGLSARISAWMATNGIPHPGHQGTGGSPRGSIGYTNGVPQPEYPSPRGSSPRGGAYAYAYGMPPEHQVGARSPGAPPDYRSGALSPSFPCGRSSGLSPSYLSPRHQQQQGAAPWPPPAYPGQPLGPSRNSSRGASPLSGTGGANANGSPAAEGALLTQHTLRGGPGSFRGGGASPVYRHPGGAGEVGDAYLSAREMRRTSTELPARKGNAGAGGGGMGADRPYLSLSERARQLNMKANGVLLGSGEGAGAGPGAGAGGGAASGLGASLGYPHGVPGAGVGGAGPSGSRTPPGQLPPRSPHASHHAPALCPPGLPKSPSNSSVNSNPSPVPNSVPHSVPSGSPRHNGASRDGESAGAPPPGSMAQVWESIRQGQGEASPGYAGGAPGLGVAPSGGLHKGGSIKMTRRERDMMLAGGADGAQQQRGGDGSSGGRFGPGAPWERSASNDGRSRDPALLHAYFRADSMPRNIGRAAPPAYQGLVGIPARPPVPFGRAAPAPGSGAPALRASGAPGEPHQRQGQGQGQGPGGGLRRKGGLTRTASVPTNWAEVLEAPPPDMGTHPGGERERGAAAAQSTRGPGYAPGTPPVEGAHQNGHHPGGGWMVPVKEREVRGPEGSSGRGAKGAFEPLQRQGSWASSAGGHSESGSSVSSAQQTLRAAKGGGVGGGRGMEDWVAALQFGSDAERKSAAREIRSALKGSPENKRRLVAAHGVPPLVECLGSDDLSLVEHAAMALMNLALHGEACHEIVRAGGIPLTVRVLHMGTPAAKGYAAALLFATSKEEESKLEVLAAGGITPLLSLLSEGTLRSKKDAALALYTLSTNARCARDIVRLGAIGTLLKQVEDAEPGLEEKAVALVANLCRFAEGCEAAHTGGAMTKMVDLLEEGSTMRVKEDAAATLLQMCASGHVSHEELLAEGVLPSLVQISESSTATSEAKTLLETLRKKSAERAKGRK